MDAALLRLLAMRMRGGLRLRLMQLVSLRGALFRIEKTIAASIDRMTDSGIATGDDI